MDILIKASDVKANAVFAIRGDRVKVGLLGGAAAVISRAQYTELRTRGELALSGTFSVKLDRYTDKTGVEQVRAEATLWAEGPSALPDLSLPAVADEA